MSNIYINLYKNNNKTKLYDIIKNYGLNKTLFNKRTIVFENDFMKVSIDKKVIRFNIYKGNWELAKQLKYLLYEV